MKVHCPHDKLVPVSDLKPHPKNPNKHPADQIKRLAQILEYQGFRYPVKVSQLSGFVTSGHGRIEAAKLNGWTHVPVSFQPYEDEAQEYADVVADNAIADWASLDFGNINVNIQDLGPEFDIDLLGLRFFGVDVNDKIDEINKGDESAEWVGLPEFNEGGKYINLIFQFKTELERQQYADKHELEIGLKKNNQWIVYM